jgi:hypothetical protein
MSCVLRLLECVCIGLVLIVGGWRYFLEETDLLPG